jgi:hypothetical protein
LASAPLFVNKILFLFSGSGAGRQVLEAVSDYRPREIHIEIQNPAYYLGINFFFMEKLHTWIIPLWYKILLFAALFAIHEVSTYYLEDIKFSEQDKTIFTYIYLVISALILWNCIFSEKAALFWLKRKKKKNIV